MFSHVMIGTNDPDKSKQFYDATLGVLGVPEGFVDKQPTKHRVFWRTDRGTFGVSKPIDGQPATHANGGTIGFFCKTPEEVHAWHEAASPMAVRRLKIRPACAKGRTSTSPTCAIPTATRSARCTVRSSRTELFTTVIPEALPGMTTVPR